MNNKISNVRFTNEQIEELKSMLRSIRKTGYHSFVDNPVQFQIYRQLGMNTSVKCCVCINFDEWIQSLENKELFREDHEVHLEYCKHHAIWMTNPYDGRLEEIEKRLLGDISPFSNEGKKIMERYFKEDMSDIVNMQYRCGLHIGRLKEIAVRI